MQVLYAALLKLDTTIAIKSEYVRVYSNNSYEQVTKQTNNLVKLLL